MQQRLLRPVRERGGDLHLLSQIVRVRVDTEQLDVDRQLVAVLDGVVARPGGISIAFDPMITMTARAQRDDRRSRGRSPDSPARGSLPGRGAARPPDRSRAEPPGHAVWRDDRPPPGRPPDEVSLGSLHVEGGHALETGLAVAAVETARPVGAIDANDRVVDGPVFGVELHCPYERGSRASAHARRCCGRRRGRPGSQPERTRHGENEIRRAQLPPALKAGGARQIGGMALGRCRPSPSAAERQSAPRVSRRSPTKCGSTGSGSHGGMRRASVARPMRSARGFTLGIGHQRKRHRVLAFPVAGDAVRVEDGRDVLVERRRVL